MKNLCKISILLLLFTLSFGQDWSASFSVDPYPSPYLSDWQSDPTIAQLEITNGSNDNDVVIVSLEVRNSSGATLMQSHSKRMLFNSLQTSIIYPSEYMNWNVSFINSDFKDKTTRSGMFPEGDYEASIKIVNLWGTELIDEQFVYFTITQPEPPELVSPVDNETIFMENPVFQWLPSQFFSQNQIIYTLKIVELLNGQIPSQAINANYPIFENFNITETEYEYSVGDYPLEKGKTYVWQITALDFSGKPATKNNGKSEINTFVYQAENGGITSTIQLISPADDDIIYTNRPTFIWDSEGENILTVVEILNGQTPQMAIRFNPPIIDYQASDLEYDFTPNTPLENNKQYAWQLKPLTYINDNYPVNRFNVSVPKNNFADFLPDRLPILSTSAAYIDLKNNADRLDNYSITPDSTQITISGEMHLILPSISSNSEVLVDGNLTFDVNSLNIIIGQFAGDIDAGTNTDFDLSTYGTPIKIKKVRFNQTAANPLQLFAAPSLFKNTNASTELLLNIDASGDLSGNAFANVNQKIPVTDDNRVQFNWQQISGTITGNPQAGTLTHDLKISGNLSINSNQNTIHFPVDLNVNNSDITLNNSITINDDITLNQTDYSLNLKNLSLNQLVYDNVFEKWRFEILSDASLAFNKFNIEVPLSDKIQINEFGANLPEINEISFNANYVDYAGVKIKPVALRALSQTVDLFSNSNKIQCMFDLDISLINLAGKYPELNKVPFRINNAEYNDGEFTGLWNPRTFQTPINLNISDSLSIKINQVVGEFLNSNGGSESKINIAGQVNDIPFSLENMQLSPDGFFNGKIENINEPTKWGASLQFRPQNQTLVLREYNSLQQIYYEIDGTIEFSDFYGNPVTAEGEGYYDLIENNLTSGEFIVDDEFVLGIGQNMPLFGIPCEKNAKITDSGLQFTPKSKIILNDNHEITATFVTNTEISLPDWKIKSANINFSQSFNLLADDLSLLNWKSTTLDSSDQQGDFFLLCFPDRPIIIDENIATFLDSQSKLRYNDTDYSIRTVFSNDFRFDISARKVNTGKVELFVSDDKVGELNSTGLHLGEFFGNTLADQKIGLPDTNVAYIDLSENKQIQFEDKNGQTRLFTSQNQTAIIHIPALQYGKANSPTFRATVDLMINKTSNQVASGTVNSQNNEVSLVNNGLPIICKKIAFSNNRWSASIVPNLPKSLQSSAISAENIEIKENGIQNFSDGFMQYGSNPQDSVRVGQYLKVMLDGVRFINSSTNPQISISGDIASRLFDNNRIHFTSKLAVDTSDFELQVLNKELALGDGILKLYDNENIQISKVPMNASNLTIYFGALLKLGNFSSGFNLDLPELALSGNGLNLIDQNSSISKELEMFGTILTFNDFDINFNITNKFDLILQGKIKLFGKNFNITGLHVNGNSQIADTLLFSKNNGKAINDMLSVKKLKIKNSKLIVQNILKMPGLFPANKKQNFNLEINPNGQWLDIGGNLLSEKSINIIEDEKKFRQDIGNQKFKVSGVISGITLSQQGDNSNADLIVDYQVNTSWPQKQLIGSADSVTVATYGKYTFTDTTYSTSWTIDNYDDDIATLMEDKIFLNASVFSMKDTSVFTILFNANMQLPLPQDIVNGEVELVGSSLTRNAFKLGKLHAGECSVAGITLELHDFNFVQNGEVNSSEIAFTETKSEVKDTTYHADYYLSFGGSISTEIPGFEAGIDRFVIFKSSDQFHLLIENAALKIGSAWNSNLNLIGSVWEKETGVEFRWLVGGNMGGDIFKGSGINGASIVGELSYREVINLNGQSDKIPGFGLLLKVDTEIDLKPIPVKLTGFGAGFFWNPSPEVKDLVRKHLGFSSDVTSEFSDIIDSYDDDMMTLWEIYLYGSGVIPEKKTIDAKVLLTLATDRIRLDAKVSPTEELKVGNAIDLSGWLVAECAWKQDFSEFKYFSGHLKIGGKPKESKYIFSLPETASTSLDFIITKEGQFAVAGDLETTMYGNINIDMDFTFGNPGFVFNGSVGYGFNIAEILKVEAGMDLMVYLYWLDPVKFGGYAALWVEGSFIDDWIAGFHGEMGAALMGAPDFYLYGYAELEGTILGVSKTVRAWAKWEKDGGCSAGTGADPTMQALIEESKETAEEIMTVVSTLKSELGLGDILAGLSDQDMQQLINRWQKLSNTYFQTWQSDYNDMKSVARETVEKLDMDDQQIAENEMSTIIEKFNNNDPSDFHVKIDSLQETAQQLKPIWQQIKTDLTSKQEKFVKDCESIADDLNNIDFGLDTLLITANIPENPIKNPMIYSTNSIEGIQSPVFTYDETIDQQNQKNQEELQKLFDTWLTDVEKKIIQIRAARKKMYAVLGPKGKSSQMYTDVMDPILISNSQLMSQLDDLNQAFKNLYRKYNNMTTPWDLDDAMNWWATNENHRTRSNLRRGMALGILGINSDDLSDNAIDRYRQLGNLFYRSVPKVLMQDAIQKTDSLLLKFERNNQIIHQNIYKQQQIATAQTDALWEKYAELSSKLYSILEEYRSYSDRYPGLSLANSIDAIIDSMQTEFTFPTVDYNVSVSDVDGFKPTIVSINPTSDNKNLISEYAASFNDQQTISFGHADNIKLEYMLKHGVTYWYETDDGGIANPFNDAQTKTITMTPRFRNQAGISSTINSKTLTLHGKDWKYNTENNSVTTDFYSGSSYICIVHWPYPGRKAYSTLNDAGSLDAHPAINYTSHRDELEIVWILKYNSAEVNIAKHEIELKQGKKTIFGPEEFPVTTTSDTFRVTIDGLSLRANKGKPVKVIINEYDVTGKKIGGTTNDGDKPNPLYIDTSKPKFVNNNYGRNNNPEYAEYGIVYSFSGAVDEVKYAKSIHSVFLNKPEQYEYKLLKYGSSTENIEWKSLTDTSEIKVISMLSNLFLGLGKRPYRDSLNFVVRAKHLNPKWNTGYSDPVTYMIPQVWENEPPTRPEFKVLGINDDNNLEIEITKEGTDNISGVKCYPWKFTQNLYRSENKYMEYSDFDSLYFDAEDVKVGSVLNIPLPTEKIDIENQFNIQLYAMDYSGNFQYSQQSVTPQTPEPEIEVKLLEGLSPFEINVEFNINKLSDQYIDKVRINIGTAVGLSDITSLQKSYDQLYNQSTFKYSNSDTIRISNVRTTLPESVGEGDEVFLDIISIRGGEDSEPVQNRLKIPLPLFDSVITAENGDLVLPIINDAFDGDIAEVRYALGFYKADLIGQNRYQFDTQAFTTLTSEVKAGTNLILPIKASDVAPKSLIALKVKSSSGEKCFTYRELEITPTKPKVTAALKIGESEYNRFHYDLKVSAFMGSKIQQSHIDSGFAKVTLKIGSEVGKDDIEVYKADYQPYDDPKILELVNTGATYRTIWIDDFLSKYKQITITATGQTIYGKEADTSFVVTVPWPEKFCESPSITFNQKFAIEAIRHGYADSTEIKGYQIAVGDNENYSLHPYGSDVDVSTENWKTGERVEFPLSINDLGKDSIVTYFIGIRAIKNDGSFKENTFEMSTLMEPKVSVTTDLNRYENIKVNITGQIDPEILNQISPNYYLEWAFYKDDEQVYGGTIVVSPSGNVDIQKPLPDRINFSDVYEFRSWYWHTDAQQTVQWRTTVRMPSEPLFRTMEIDSNDVICLNICNVGFNGNLSVSGYKFAIGTSTNPEEYRAFPVDNDFTEITIGNILKLPQTLAGLPRNVTITLRAVADNGEFHDTAKEAVLRPAMPHVINLEIDNNGNFTAQFDPGKFDSKSRSMDCWINDGNSTTISFDQFNLPLENVTFDSHFSDEYLDRVFYFEGLNLGVMENSLEFNYKFKVQKDSNGNYVVVPLNE